MGVGVSCVGRGQEDEPCSLGRWKELPDITAAKELYIKEKSLTSESKITELELRALLDEKAACSAIIAYSRTVQLQQLFDCWVELKKFDLLQAFRREKLRTLCELYSSLASLRNPAPSDNAFAEGKRKLDDFGKEVTDTLSAEQALNIIVSDVRRCCFMLIHDLVFLQFKKTTEYENMCTSLTESFNGVGELDFECFDEIGEGASALVLHCRKISTGVDYAMKIQPKYDLLKCCGGNKAKVIQEVKAYTQCKHPYITSLAYAFQTETLAVLVMPVALCGDLRRSLGGTVVGRISKERVVFYAAEIASALQYLHKHGIIYRDLKPGNVLLNVDGHVMLADFGSVADCAGKFEIQPPRPARSATPLDDGVDANSMSLSISHNDNASDLLGHLFDATQQKMLAYEGHSPDNASAVEAHKFPRDNETPPEFPPHATTKSMCTDRPSGSSAAKRTKSIVGTLAYMAPEVVGLFGQAKADRVGYTHAVDWWGLGCTIYTLLVGKEPFARVSYDRLRIIFPALLLRHNNDTEAAHGAVFGVVDYASYEDVLGLDGKDVIQSLLRFDPDERLCTSRRDINDINALFAHPFFADIDWEGIAKKTCPPPYLPVDEVLPAFRNQQGAPANNAYTGHSVAEMLRFCSKEHWLAEEYREHTSMPSGKKESKSKSKSSVSLVGFFSSASAKSSAKVDVVPDKRISKYRVAEKYQAHFRRWNYVAPAVIQEEVAASVRLKNSAKSTARHSTLRSSVTQSSLSRTVLAPLAEFLNIA